MKKLKKILNIKSIKYLLIPILLFSFWAFSLLVLVQKESIFTLITKYDKSSISDFKQGKIYEGDRIIGSIEAKENNFGIISIEFIPSRLVDYNDEDILFFRIKEKGSSTWLSQNEYRSGLINSSPEFPFGFPLIKDSKGKTYVFEIESTKGNDLNALSIYDKKDLIKAKYVYLKAEIFENPKLLLEILIKKNYSSLTDLDLILESLPYMLPLVFYLAYLIFKKNEKTSRAKKISNFKIGKFILFHLVFFLILLDIILNNFNLHYSYFLILLLFWVVAVAFYRLSYTVTVFYAGTVFLLSVVSILFNMNNILVKSSIWLYFLLLISAVQFFWEIKFNKKYKSVKNYFNEIISK